MAYIDINDTESTFAGLATAANQLIEISLLTSIDSKIPTLGQKTMAGSSPVVIASDQSTVKVNLTDSSGASVGTSGSPIFVDFSPSAISVNAFNQVSAVPSGVLTQIVSYTVPALQQNVLERVSVSGENIALYTVLINGTPVDMQRTYFGGALNTQFDFTSSGNLGTVLSSGDVVSVTVLHNRPDAADFESRIQMSQLV